MPRVEQDILEEEAEDADKAEQEIHERTEHDMGHEEGDHGNDGHGDHGGMHEGHEQMFRRRFFVSTLLSIPVLLYSEALQGWLGFSVPVFPGSEWINPVFAVIVFAYGGVPFLKMAVPELRDRSPGMMTLISMAISVAFVYSLASVIFPTQSAFFWELVTLIDIMLLGHWIEMRSVRRASSALDELAKLMPDTAERITEAGDTEEVPVSELSEGDIVLVRPGASVPADGVGFVFTDDNPIVGVDLDDCRDPETGDVDDAALDIIERLDSYTEVSPSGTGYHILITGKLPEGRNRRGSIELYDTARFFTVSGDHVEETPSHVARRQDALVAIHREYVQDTDSDTASESGHRHTADKQSSTNGPADVDVDLEDEELLEKAGAASNGAKFERLWNGNTVGYDSQSEADMALCYLLAFWTGGDQMRVDRLFRQSGLLRKKWDEVHYADGSTYGEKTIDRAIANTSEFYDPGSGDESTQSHASSGTSTTDAGRNDSGRSHAYLTEKNRLLTDRVDELEATLDQKDERIDTLEAEIERLTEELAERDRETDRTHEAHAVDAGADDDESETTSVWGRTKRLFGSGSK